MAPPPDDVDAYLAAQPDDARAVLQQVRAAIHRALPGATERIKYGMPAVVPEHGHTVYFAGWKRHVGLYPVPRLDGELEDEVAPYRTNKDSVRFPYAEPVPYDLVERVAAAMVGG